MHKHVAMEPDSGEGECVCGFAQLSTSISPIWLVHHGTSVSCDDGTQSQVASNSTTMSK